MYCHIGRVRCAPMIGSVGTLYDFFVESVGVEGRFKRLVERGDLENFLNWLVKSYYFSYY